MGRTILLIFSTLFLWVNQSIVCAPTSCITGKGQIVTENRNISDFSVVKVNGSMDVNIISGDTFSVQVTDYENLLPHLKTEKEGNVLELSFEGCIRNSRAKVKITMPRLKGVYALGSGDIKVSGEFKSDNGVKISSLGSGDVAFNALIDGNQTLKIAAKGSGDVHINTVAQNMDLTFMSLGSGDASINVPGTLHSIEIALKGSGDLEIKGDSASDAKIMLMGSGDCDARNIKINNLAVKLMGSGDINATVKESLDASLMGSGDIIFHGNPKNFEIHKMGSGDVIKRN